MRGSYLGRLGTASTFAGSASGRSPGDAVAWAFAFLSLCAAVLFSPAAASAAGPPLIEASWVTGVTATGANLRAEIEPNGFSTTYRFEYITEAAYQANWRWCHPWKGSSAPRKCPRRRSGRSARDRSRGVRHLSKLTPATLTATGRWRPTPPVRRTGRCGPSPRASEAGIPLARQPCLGAGLPGGQGRWSDRRPRRALRRRGHPGSVRCPGRHLRLCHRLRRCQTVRHRRASTSRGELQRAGAPKTSRPRSTPAPTATSPTAPLIGSSPPISRGPCSSAAFLAAASWKAARPQTRRCPVPAPLPDTWPTTCATTRAEPSRRCSRRRRGTQRGAPQAFEVAFAAASPDLSHVVLSSCAALTADATEMLDGPGQCDPEAHESLPALRGRAAGGEPVAGRDRRAPPVPRSRRRMERSRAMARGSTGPTAEISSCAKAARAIRSTKRRGEAGPSRPRLPTARSRSSPKPSTVPVRRGDQSRR